jgi:hypothetical protein
MTYEPWNGPSRKRYYAIPLELAYEAQQYAVSIGDTCVEALRRKIHDKKERLYGTTCCKDRV